MPVRHEHEQVEMVPLAELRPYDGNAKKHTNEQVDAVEASIREFGFRNPVLAWHNDDGAPEIVAGHARCIAARNLGMGEVPVIFVDDLSDAQRRALTLVDNQTTMMTGWDEDQLSYELDILSSEFDMSDFGFALSDITDDVETMLDGISEDDVRQDVDRKCSEGQIWKLGDHRLMCGDSTDADQVAKLMGGDLADMLLTDPPYNVALGHHMRPSEARQLHRRTDGLVIENDSWESVEEFDNFLAKAFANADSSMRPGAAFYIWHAHVWSLPFFSAAGRAGFEIRQCLVWAKSTFVLGRQDYQWRHEPCLYGWKGGAAHYFVDDRRQTTVFEDSMPNINAMSKAEMRDLLKEIFSDRQSDTVLHEDKPSRSDEHPTMKPVKLMARQIANSSKKGWIVLDLFGGSGSTMMACEQLGRRCYMMELDPHYCDVIIDRWERFTGNVAEMVIE